MKQQDYNTIKERGKFVVVCDQDDMGALNGEWADTMRGAQALLKKEQARNKGRSLSFSIRKHGE